MGLTGSRGWSVTGQGLGKCDCIGGFRVVVLRAEGLGFVGPLCLRRPTSFSRFFSQA